MKSKISSNRWQFGPAAFIGIAIFLILTACDDRSTTYVNPDDRTPPPVPSGINTITGDGIIWVQWDAIIGVADLDGFKIWRSTNNVNFVLIATVGADVTEYEDNEVINGVTYYYGLSSFDRYGNESDESFNYEFAFDTPRPEGFDEVIFTFNDPAYDHISGFDFSREVTLPFDDSRCDIFAEYDTSLAAFYIWLGDNGRYIQDMGFTDGFDDITFAPETGWSQFPYMEAIVGHTYVLLTWDNHYAKIRVTDFGSVPAYSITFDWGYQIDPGNRELKVDPGSVLGQIVTAESAN